MADAWARESIIVINRHFFIVVVFVGLLGPRVPIETESDRCGARGM